MIIKSQETVTFWRYARPPFFGGKYGHDSSHVTEKYLLITVQFFFYYPLLLNVIYPGLHIFQTKNNIVHSSLIFSAPPLNDVLFRPSLFLRLNFVLLTKCVYYCIMCAEERSGPARQSVQTLLSCHQSPLTVLTTVLCCV